MDTNTTDSLVSQYYQAFTNTTQGLDTTCNRLSYPLSRYDNIKNGMGVQALPCPSSPSNLTDSNTQQSQVFGGSGSTIDATVLPTRENE